jgi:hypothetical protein
MARKLDELMQELAALIASGTDEQDVVEALPDEVFACINRNWQNASANNPVALGVLIGQTHFAHELWECALSAHAHTVCALIDEIKERKETRTRQFAEVINRLAWSCHVLKGLAWYISRPREDRDSFVAHIIPEKLQSMVVKGLLETPPLINEHLDLVHPYEGDDRLKSSEVASQFTRWFERLRIEQHARVSTI